MSRHPLAAPSGNDDWQELQDGINNSDGEFVIPAGVWRLSQPLVVGARCQLKGKSIGITTLLATNQNDILRTEQAQQIIDTKQVPAAFDEHFLIENLTLDLGTDNKSSSAVTVCQPGENNEFHRLRTRGGGFGITVIGVGTPGINLENISLADHAQASIHFVGIYEGVTGEEVGRVLHWGGPTILNRISSDNRRTRAPLIWVDKCATPIEIHGLKAEGGFDCLVQYDRVMDTYGTGAIVVDNNAALTLRTIAWNCATPGGGTVVKINGGPVTVEADDLYFNGNVPMFVRDYPQDVRMLTGRPGGGVIRHLSYP